MAKQKEKKTNAMRMLDAKGISYQVHTYDHDDGRIDGLSVAKKLNEDPSQVFKTLVSVGDDKNLYVFCIPVEMELDLKKCARVAGVKKVEMLAVKDLFAKTGYIRGGCSPIGMKKLYTTYYDETMVLFDTVIFSGGQIGTQVELAPVDVLAVTNGSCASLCKE